MAERFTEMISCVIRDAIWSRAQASLDAIGAQSISHYLPVHPLRPLCWLPMAPATPFSRELLLPEGSLLPQRCPRYYAPRGRQVV